MHRLPANILDLYADQIQFENLILLMLNHIHMYKNYILDEQFFSTQLVRYMVAALEHGKNHIHQRVCEFVMLTN